VNKKFPVFLALAVSLLGTTCGGSLAQQPVSLPFGAASHAPWVLVNPKMHDRAPSMVAGKNHAYGDARRCGQS